MRRDMFPYPFLQRQCLDRFPCFEPEGTANILVIYFIGNGKTNHLSDSLMLRNDIVELYRGDLLTALVDELFDASCQFEIALLI